MYAVATNTYREKVFTHMGMAFRSVDGISASHVTAAAANDKQRITSDAPQSGDPGSALHG